MLLSFKSLSVNNTQTVFEHYLILQTINVSAVGSYLQECK